MALEGLYFQKEQRHAGQLEGRASEPGFSDGRSHSSWAPAVGGCAVVRSRGEQRSKGLGWQPAQPGVGSVSGAGGFRCCCFQSWKEGTGRGQERRGGRSSVDGGARTRGPQSRLWSWLPRNARVDRFNPGGDCVGLRRGPGAAGACRVEACWGGGRAGEEGAPGRRQRPRRRLAVRVQALPCSAEAQRGSGSRCLCLSFPLCEMQTTLALTSRDATALEGAGKGPPHCRRGEGSAGGLKPEAAGQSWARENL